MSTAVASAIHVRMAVAAMRQATVRVACAPTTSARCLGAMMGWQMVERQTSTAAVVYVTPVRPVVPVSDSETVRAAYARWASVRRHDVMTMFKTEKRLGSTVAVYAIAAAV